MRIGTYLGSPPFQGGGDPKGGAVVPGSTHRDIGARTIHNHPGLRPPLLANLAKEGSLYACSHAKMVSSLAPVHHAAQLAGARDTLQIAFPHPLEGQRFNLAGLLGVLKLRPLRKQLGADLRFA